MVARDPTCRNWAWAVYFAWRTSSGYLMPAMPRVIALLLPLALACSSPTAPDAEGMWGGTQVSLELTRSGGTLTYLCGTGTIDSTWTLNSDGRFTATGLHYFGGGPAPIQGRPSHPARYVGEIEDDDLTLMVTLTDLGQTLGPYRLVRGGPSVSEICV